MLEEGEVERATDNSVRPIGALCLTMGEIGRLDNGGRIIGTGDEADGATGLIIGNGVGRMTARHHWMIAH